VFLRVSLATDEPMDGFRTMLANRVELATPATGEKRLLEGAFMRYGGGQAISGGDAYSGDMFHGSPLLLPLGYVLDRIPHEAVAVLIFALVDIVCALCLRSVARSYRAAHGQHQVPLQPVWTPEEAAEWEALDSSGGEEEEGEGEDAAGGGKLPMRNLWFWDLWGASSRPGAGAGRARRLAREAREREELKARVAKGKQGAEGGPGVDATQGAADAAARAALLKLENKSEKRYLRAVNAELTAWINIVPEVVALLYLLNPLTMACSVARTTAQIDNMFVAAAAAAACSGRAYLSLLCLAIAAHLGVYPVLLLPAVCLLLRDGVDADPSALSAWRHGEGEGRPRESEAWWAFRRSQLWAHADRGRTGPALSVSASCLVFALFFGALTLVAYGVAGNWNFVRQGWGFVLTAPDSRPNIGVWWYYMTEQFEYFRPLFTFVFQYWIVALVGPLTVSLRGQPLALFWLVFAITACFRSYPSYSEQAFYLCTIAVFTDICANYKMAFLASQVYIYVWVINPMLYRLWIYLGSGNSNFYYGFTLGLVVGETMVLGEFLRSALLIEEHATRDLLGLKSVADIVKEADQAILRRKVEGRKALLDAARKPSRRPSRRAGDAEEEEEEEEEKKDR